MLPHIAEELSGHGARDQQANDCLCQQRETFMNPDRAFMGGKNDRTKHCA